MAIKINISKWLGIRKMSQRDLSKQTGIRPATVHALYHEKIKRIEIDQINNICKALDCQPGDILEYIPDESDSLVE